MPDINTIYNIQMVEAPAHRLIFWILVRVTVSGTPCVCVLAMDVAFSMSKINSGISFLI